MNRYPFILEILPAIPCYGTNIFSEMQLQGWVFLKVGHVPGLLFNLGMVCFFLFLTSLELVTTSGFLMYQLIYYIDGRASIANADQGLLYADDGLQNCSVLMVNLLSFNQAAVSSNQGQVQTRS